MPRTQAKWKPTNMLDRIEVFSLQGAYWNFCVLLINRTNTNLMDRSFDVKQAE
jgi:hypothetical protein